MKSIRKNYRFDVETDRQLNAALDHHNQRMEKENFPKWSESDFIRFLIQNWYKEGRQKRLWE